MQVTVAKTAGFCFGVQRALELTQKSAALSPTCTLGELIHNRQVVEELAGEFEGKVKFGKVNVDEQPELAMRYGVQSIPTLILFRGGEPVNASVGVVPADSIRAMLG